uniref:DNA polymerase delta subunit 3 n=1 Tax=Ciona intestinalis TaxID=7719 RepID=H2Y139_CIOIN|nr:DNA polymerase delta subunit 3 [Ciona intestinalis]|eukprot:XP_002125821.1 DNA polymerase delta subunit 3 [Ciona intestinalis]
MHGSEHDMDMYLCTLDELVEDDKKIVTYKCLSQELAISASKSKELLKLYSKNAEKNNVSIIYCVTGRTKTGIRVVLVQDSQLENAKSKMHKVFSCEPYSVQKSKLTDPSALYAADYEMTKKLLYKCGSYGSVRFNGSTALTDDEINQARTALATTAAANESENTIKHETTQQKSKKISPKSSKTGINNMFGTSSSKVIANGTKIVKPAEQVEIKKEQTKNEKPVQSKPSVSTTNKKSKSHMQSFMTKGKGDLFAESKSSKPSAQIKKEATPPLAEEPSLDINDDFESPKVKVEQEQNEIVKKPEPEKSKKSTSKQKIKKNSGSKKQSRTNSEELPAKKRRRIQEFSSSSEDEAMEEEEEEGSPDIIPASPPPLPKPSRSCIKVGEKNPRKRRVLKSKTFVDADGSMLTEKEWVEEACSDNDYDKRDSDDKKVAKQTDEPKVQKKVSPVAEKSSLKKSKQSSLMGFFSKK